MTHTLRPRLIYIGYRIDQPRQEAVTINAQLYCFLAQDEGYTVDQLSYSGSMTTPLKLWRFLRQLRNYCKKNERVIIHDFFVMPAMSRLVLTWLWLTGIHAGYVKSFSNHPGGGSWWGVVGIYRQFCNSHRICQAVARQADSITYHTMLPLPHASVLSIPLRYVPQPVQLHEGPVRCAYLGHALLQKGVGLFPEIIECVENCRPGRAVFRFSFSSHWDARWIENKLETMPACHFQGETDPQVFFSEADIYILPISTHFAAAGAFNTIWEAMSSGCCVITVADSRLPDIIDANCGILLDEITSSNIAEKIVELIDNAEQRHKLRLAAAEAYKKEENGRSGLIRNQLTNIYQQVSERKFP